MRSIRNAVALLLLSQLQFFVTTISCATAQDADSKIPTLGTRFERKPWAALPYRDFVTRFAFSPDGTETWCLAGSLGVLRGDSRGRALVFHQKASVWENIPLQDDPAVFHDVAFSLDGKTTWIGISSDNDQTLRVRQRPTGTKEWNQVSMPMPANLSVVDKFWFSPNRQELWMNTSGHGLLRANLKDKSLLQYVNSDVRQFENIRHATLVEDNAADLVFTSDSKYAICAASGGGDYGITKIDLATDESTNSPVTDAFFFEHLVVSPDNSCVWCISNNSYLWCFDIKSEKWLHRLSSEEGMPISSIDSLVCTPDGKHVWIAGNEGVACYLIGQKKWIGLTGDQWFMHYEVSEIQTVPLAITADGRNVVAGHSNGLALFEADGKLLAIIESVDPKTHSSCSKIVAIPNSPNFLCALENKSGAGGLYLLDTKKRSLEILFVVNAPVTALEFSKSNHAWVAMPKSVYELNLVDKQVVQQHPVTDKSP